MTTRQATVRMVFAKGNAAESITVDLDEGEHVIGAEHEGARWWVYICREEDVPTRQEMRDGARFDRTVETLTPWLVYFTVAYVSVALVLVATGVIS